MGSGIQDEHWRGAVRLIIIFFFFFSLSLSLSLSLLLRIFITDFYFLSFNFFLLPTRHLMKISLKLELHADEVTTVPPPEPLFVSESPPPPSSFFHLLPSNSSSAHLDVFSCLYQILAPRLGYLPQVSKQALQQFRVSRDLENSFETSDTFSLSLFLSLSPSLSLSSLS